MSEHEIQFGDLEEAQRLQRLRPDRNRQLAVVPCGRPDPGDLPIFVDLDVLREMEAHAHSDTRVELGGVMLGGQFEDDQRHPYVVVQDSLRARHYESSKGSFKFTHDTWSDITRRREEFPSELQMVGWYHTHPDWGIFLSGMDMFICDHFFNRPLDVALVIDPCRRERGWFQWTSNPAQRTRKTGGYYLFASRHRQADLESYAAELEGRFAMAHDPRSTGPGYPPTFYPVPVNTAPDSRTAWLAVGVLGTLAMQFVLLALIAWRLFLGGPAAVADRPAAPRPAAAGAGGAAGAADRPDGADQQLLAERLAAQRELLDRVVAALGDGPPAVVSQLEQQRQENARLETDMRVYRDLEAKTHGENQTLAHDLNEAEERNKGLRTKLKEAEESLADARSEARGLKSRLARFEEQQLAGLPDGGADEPAGLAAFWRKWWMWISGGVLLLTVAALGYAVLATHAEQDRYESAEEAEGPAGGGSRSRGDRDVTPH